MPRQPSGPPAESRHDRFIEAARETECGDDKARFETPLGKIAKARPKGEPKTRR
jgi:hypothetical protein